MKYEKSFFGGRSSRILRQAGNGLSVQTHNTAGHICTAMETSHRLLSYQAACRKTATLLIGWTALRR
jgi:hypothetical protein